MKSGSNIISEKMHPPEVHLRFLKRHQSDAAKSFLELIYKSKKGRLEGWIAKAEMLLKYELGKGESAYTGEDIISEIAAELMEGRRTWDMEKFPDLKSIMPMLIKSQVSNIVRREQRQVHLSDGTEEEDGCLSIEYISCFTKKEIERDCDVKESIVLCRKALVKEPELLDAFDRMRKGSTPKQIASALGITTTMVYGIRKKIFRRLRRAVNYCCMLMTLFYNLDFILDIAGCW